MSLYDSWYMRAVHPEKPLGLWIRHTFHETPEGVRGAHWFTLFTPDGVEARKARFDGRPAGGGERFAGSAGDSRWNLRVEPRATAFAHLPARWMYRTPIPRTKPVSVAPLAVLTGEAAIGGAAIAVDGWPGMVGHNWGAEHAHRWIWLHSAGFDGEPGSWLDVTLARLRLGGRLTPWLANGALGLAGGRRRLGGLFRLPSVEATAAGARIVLTGRGLRLELDVEPRPAATVVWRYSDPGGAGHYAANCSIAALRVRVVQDGSERILATGHRAAYELGSTDPPPGYAIQPFPDP